MTEAEKKEIAETFITGLSNRDGKLLESITTDDIVWSRCDRAQSVCFGSPN
jgi:hypothetical protein